MNDVPIPYLMRGLKLDRRGYPIPVGVLIDSDGKPHFTINDEAKRQSTLKEDTCGICGNGLLKARWIVGGPGAAFHPQGAYIDPPMHESCAKYALQVCPYLAAPSYSRRIDDRGLDRSKVPEHLMLRDPTIDPARPAVFVLAMYVGQRYVKEGNWLRYILPMRPFRKVEYWCAGERIPDDIGEGARDAFLDALD